MSGIVNDTGVAPGSIWVGIDLGTQSAKAIIVDDLGGVLGQGTAPLTSTRSPQRHEQDPHQWITSAASALGAALNPLSDSERARIKGVAICATSGTITLVDKEGRPRGAGLMYDDVRAGSLAGEVQAADPALWKRLGYRIQPSWALPKIVWLAREGLLGHPDSRTHGDENKWVAHQGDVIASAMTGHRVPTDWSHALKSGYDTLETSWPTDALGRLGLSPDHLPEVVSPGSVIGFSSSAWAELTGLPSGTPIMAGMTDGCAAQISAGTLEAGDWHTVVGTTLVVKTVSTGLIRDDAGAVYSHRSPEENLWFPGGASTVGAGALTALFPDTDLASATDRIADRFSGGLDELPPAYPLTTVGERFPLLAPQARGFVLVDGVALPLESAQEVLDPDTLLASVFLGIANVERLCMTVLEKAGAPVMGTVSSSGGATKNSWWMQLRADLLCRDIAVPHTSEGALGMAVLAAWSAQRGDTLAGVASRLSPVGRVVTSNPRDSRHLDVAYQRFLDALQTEGWNLP